MTAPGAPPEMSRLAVLAAVGMHRARRRDRTGHGHEPGSSQPPSGHASRRYIDGSLVLETSFQTPQGRLRITDALAVGAGERGHDLG